MTVLPNVATIQRSALLASASVIIVVAGMEDALPSVVGGLVSASGVTVVNIDNGFGTATVASLINHL